jgi:ATP-dependent Lon protease
MTVLLPKDNAKDIPELPERIRQDLELIPVGHLDEVLAIALQEATEPPMNIGGTGSGSDAVVVPPPPTNGNGKQEPVVRAKE